MSKVLVVKYQSSNRESLLDILRHAGHDVIEAGGTAPSLKKACQEQPDIVLLDVRTQPEAGFKTLLQLRGDPTTADVPVILLAGSSRVVGEQDAMKLGVNHYLTMPWKPDIVEATIKVALSEPVIAVDQTEHTLAVMRPGPSAKTPLQRAGRHTGVSSTRRDESPSKTSPKKAIGPVGLDWQALVKGFIVEKYGKSVGTAHNIKFNRITHTGPIRGLNVYKLEGVTSMLVGDRPALQLKGFNITVWATSDGRIIDRRGRIL